MVWLDSAMVFPLTVTLTIFSSLIRGSVGEGLGDESEDRAKIGFVRSGECPTLFLYEFVGPTPSAPITDTTLLKCAAIWNVIVGLSHSGETRPIPRAVGTVSTLDTWVKHYTRVLINPSRAKR
jgi:hypothetical protein